MIPTIEQVKQGIIQTPIAPTNHRITQGFGLENTHPAILHWYQQWGMLGHNGIDYGCPIGTELKAPVDLTVSNFYDDPGYGKALWSRTRQFEVDGEIYAVEIVMGHLSQFVSGTAIGKEFKQGDVCCVSGNTGQSTGPHLHEGWRVVKKTDQGGWLAQNYGNGYKGYFNQLLLRSEDMIDTFKLPGNPKIYGKSKTENVWYWCGGWESYQRLLKAGWVKPYVEVDSTDAVIVDEPFGWLK